MRRVSALAAAVLLAGCAAVPATPGDAANVPPAAPALGFFSRIKVPAGNAPFLQLAARGVQIFRCEREGKGFSWRFRQPQAELFDARGEPVARHGADYSFENRDGSRLLGSIVAYDKAGADALPWLLLSARSYGQGEFAGVTYVQRVNTRGGMPPASCDPRQRDTLLRVDFSADFVFYRPQP